MKRKKFYTVSEWSNFKKNNYFDMQELLCKRYDVILTDHKTKKQKIKSILSHINLKNVDQGLSKFNQMMQSFGNATEQLTREFDHSENHKKNFDSIWGNSNGAVPVWGNSEKQHKANLEKIWGKRN